MSTSITSPARNEAGRQGESSGRWWSWLAGVASAVLVADQLTKWWAVTTLDDQVIDVVWTLRFELVHNTGSAFSLGEGRGALISLAALLAVGLLLRSARRNGGRLALVALGLIVGGAVGNLIDRALREGDGLMGGGVVDFINFQWWPVFNIADIGVVVGAGLLVVNSWRGEPGHGADDDDSDTADAAESADVADPGDAAELTDSDSDSADATEPADRAEHSAAS